MEYFLYTRKSSESEDRQIASIPAQIEELKKLAHGNDLNIINILIEEKSAKAPGRPVFNRMMKDIQQGKAQGIICWKLDRLARNPVDGGQIGWLLQQNIIKHIQTFQRSYYPTDNVLMMNLEFGMANQYIIDLSTNIRRGQRNKIREGWYPHKPPVGYLNNTYDPSQPPIYKDPERFALVKQLWEILLEKQCSIDTLYRTARDIGLTTTRGRIINRSKFYSLFKNPFYYGHFWWNGDIYSGNHEPMITADKFSLAQGIISGKRPDFLNKHVFAFTGMIRCGECGAFITAEKKTKHQKNGNIHYYTYYRCTKRINPKCSQKTIRDTVLEGQIIDILDSVTIDSDFHKWAIEKLKKEHSRERHDKKDMIKSWQRNLNICTGRIETLVDMRLNGEICGEDYKRKREVLVRQRQKYKELLSDSDHRFDSWLDNTEKYFIFAETAKKCFETGSLEEKRMILHCLGSNLTLADRKLNIQLQIPLKILSKYTSKLKSETNRLEPLQAQQSKVLTTHAHTSNPIWWSFLNEVRTCLLSSEYNLLFEQRLDSFRTYYSIKSYDKSVN